LGDRKGGGRIELDVRDERIHMIGKVRREKRRETTGKTRNTRG